MLHPLLYDNDVLAITDFFILQVPFAHVVEATLPIPASVTFATFQNNEQLPCIKDVLSLTSMQIEELQDVTVPTRMHDVLVVPLTLGVTEKLCVVISDADPALLAKMSGRWLSELQGLLLQQLKTVRKIYIDPETGMYNKRALWLLKDLYHDAVSSFLFIHTGMSSRAASINMIRYQQVTDLLQAVVPGYLFSCGLQAFGVLFFNTAADKAGQACRLLQKHLKRDGVRKVQVGIASGCLQDNIVETAWNGLLVAEKRGPFGVCDARSLVDHPFSLPSKLLLKKIQKRWRGCSRFAVAVIAWDGPASDTIMEQESMKILQGKGECIGSEQGRTYVFLPYNNSFSLVATIEHLNNNRDTVYALPVRGIGTAEWPTLGYSKTQTLVNCSKALMHCSFLESGSAVDFDHLTLNISGDYYFDDGDYQAAGKEYRDGLQLLPGDINLLNSLGVTMVEFNQYSRAADCFKAVLQEHEDNHMALVNLGLAQQAVGAEKDAMVTLEKARQVIPEGEAVGGELFLPLGRLYTAFGFTQQAIDVLLQWSARPGSEKEFLLYRLLGKNYFTKGDHTKAIAACQRALQIYPQDSVSLSLLGALYVVEKQGDEIGMRLCKQAVDLDPANPDNLYRLAFVYLQTARWGDAKEAANLCLRRLHNHVDCGLLVAGLDLKQGRSIQAERRLKRLQKKGSITARQEVRIARHLKEITACTMSGDDQ